MKYWRGYLVAAIVAACAWGLQQFSAAHSALVDMIYPYVTRMVQTYLAEANGGVPFLVWRLLLFVGIALAVVWIVFAVIRRWNIISVVGWILAAVSMVWLVSVGMYGLNNYAGPLAEDVRMSDAQYAYSLDELEKATAFYRDEANKLAEKVARDSRGDVEDREFKKVAEDAASGFENLVTEEGYSVFAGTTQPVKKLTLAGKRTTGQTVALTGESAVNPSLPMTALPFAISHEMSHRMCISIDADADFGAFLACTHSDLDYYRYSGYLNAYWACRQALEEVSESSGDTAAVQKIISGENTALKQDLEQHKKYFGKNGMTDPQLCDSLTIWYVETQVLPLQEDDTRFDPLDESQVDLSGIVNAR